MIIGCGGLSRSVTHGRLYGVDHDRLETRDETLHGYHHQQQAHEAHHDVVACLAYNLHQASGGAQYEVGQGVDKSYGAYQHSFQSQRVGRFHEHDAVGYGSGAAEQRYGQRSDRDVVGVVLDLFVLELRVRHPRLKHVVADFQYHYAGGYAEAVGGDAEEFEEKLSEHREGQQRDERDECRSPDYGAALRFGHVLRHGQKHRHRAKRVGQGEKRCQAEKRECEYRCVGHCGAVFFIG